MRIIFFILGFLLLTSCVFAEKVILRSGLEVDGRILEKTDKFVKVDYLGTALTYYFDEVDSIDGQKVEQPLDTRRESSFQEMPVSSALNDANPLNQVATVTEEAPRQEPPHKQPEPSAPVKKKEMNTLGVAQAPSVTSQNVTPAQANPSKLAQWIKDGEKDKKGLVAAVGGGLEKALGATQ